MSQILLIDGGTTFGHSKGQLNHTLSEAGAEELRRLGHQVSVTRLDQGYDIEAEIEKFVSHDVVIFQMPGWWMGEPWTVKNTLMKSLPMVMGDCMPAMAVAARTAPRNTVPAA